MSQRRRKGEAHRNVPRFIGGPLDGPDWQRGELSDDPHGITADGRHKCCGTQAVGVEGFGILPHDCINRRVGSGQPHKEEGTR